jgi:hypothetical protein
VACFLLVGAAIYISPLIFGYVCVWVVSVWVLMWVCGCLME